MIEKEYYDWLDFVTYFHENYSLDLNNVDVNDFFSEEANREIKLIKDDKDDDTVFDFLRSAFTYDSEYELREDNQLVWLELKEIIDGFWVDHWEEEIAKEILNITKEEKIGVVI